MTALGKYRAFIDLKPKLRNVDVAAALGFARELKCYIISPDGSNPMNTIGLWNVERINPLMLSQDRNILTKLLEIIGSKYHGSISHF